MASKQLRLPKQPIDLFAAVPKVNQTTPYNFEQDIQRRNSPIGQMGEQANVYAEMQAQKKMQARQEAMRRALSQMQNTQYPRYAISGGGNGAYELSNMAGQWRNPLGNVKPWFGFGASYKDGGSHKGMDWAVPSGTQVFAPWGGTVLGYENQPGGFGNNLRLQFDNGIFGILGHLSGTKIKPGSKFTIGDLLALSGNSGRSTGDHLHFETRWDMNDPSSAFDPSQLFGW